MHYFTRRLLVVIAACGAALYAAALPASAQGPTAEIEKKQNPDAKSGDTQPDGGDTAPTRRLGTWELPALEVAGDRPVLREDELIGDYRQPRWTAHRRFPTARVYVRPQGEFDVETWVRIKTPRNGRSTTETRFEIEIGLPYRFQLDIYLISEKGGDRGPAAMHRSAEIRWAPFDWGVCPGNPALYFEWINKDGGEDVFEAKLLFGDGFGQGWHWAVNAIWEQEIEAARETVLEGTIGLSKTLVDSIFALGIEGKFEVANVKHKREHWPEDLRIGPSFQIRFLPQAHFDVALLFGFTNRSKDSDIFFVFGWEL